VKSRIKCSFAKYLSFDKIAPNSFAEILMIMLFSLFSGCDVLPAPLSAPLLWLFLLDQWSCVFTRISPQS
jgi:hypothetical protein